MLVTESCTEEIPFALSIAELLGPTILTKLRRPSLINAFFTIQKRHLRCAVLGKAALSW